MDYDKDKIDDVVLALLFLTMQSDRAGTRAWKSQNWDAMDRLHQKGYIGDPKSAAKSVAITEEGKAKAEQLFRRFFGKNP